MALLLLTFRAAGVGIVPGHQLDKPSQYWKVKGVSIRTLTAPANPRRRVSSVALAKLI